MSVICIACSKQFKKNEDVHGTDCGHIYHFKCVLKWKSRSKRCPACNRFNPFSRIIDLVFDEGASESVEKVCSQDAQTDLGNVYGKIDLLQKHVKEKEDKILSQQGDLNKQRDLIKTLTKSLEDMKLQNKNDKKQSQKSESTAKDNHKKSSIQQSSKAENVQKNGSVVQSSKSGNFAKNENKKETAQPQIDLLQKQLKEKEDKILSQQHDLDKQKDLIKTLTKSLEDIKLQNKKSTVQQSQNRPPIFLPEYDYEEEIDDITNSFLTDTCFDDENAFDHLYEMDDFD